MSLFKQPAIIAGMETLAKLFGSENKVKIMRLFLFNPDTVFNTKEIAERIKSNKAQVNREMISIKACGLARRRVSVKAGGGNSFSLDKHFPYLIPLQNFLINSEPIHSKELVHKINKLGNIKLILISGIFIQDGESRVDLLIVGDGVKKPTLENTIRNIESEVGKELRYAYFTTEDFKYRFSMFDKLIRDILDYPHKKILNRLSII